ncbi:MAG: hypothetical protein Terrestrivirus4_50 [Terrestrivirus sp.]|uniref:Uncharacterized protein n=1 Tax=Terrestrivirus sp. TaxID=2487775 RepID=A0A3G4ZMB4_9VIRU|nr:MAG: hypothetical protein Terrestrivirus4_50 [Terrestrivirus sp.]
MKFLILKIISLQYIYRHIIFNKPRTNSYKLWPIKMQNLLKK